MSWGERSFSFREQGAKTPPPLGGGATIIYVSDLQSRFALCGSVNKSLFYQAN